ncbi:MAG TPA: ABC-F family ATP-binding cassette domain-containing protein [Trueperaceae bacterium]
MSLLTLVGVGYDLPGGPLFEDVNLNLAPGSRVALVGENGAGKTTLMRLAVGEVEPARGRVERRGTVAWLPQELERSAAPLGAMAHGDGRRRSGDGRQASGAADGVRAVDARPGSGGERQRARLEAILAREPDVLLLDEPTHHLDVAGMEWLEGVLLAWPGAVLLVSHDRAFLDAVATETAFLERGALRLEAGNHSEASARRAAEDAARLRRHKAQSARRRQLESEYHRHRSAARSAGSFNKNRVKDGNLLYATAKAETVSRRLARRAKALATRLEREAVEGKPWEDNRRLSFVAAPSSPGPSEVIVAEGLVVRRGGRTIVDGLDLYLMRGDKLALLGPNGVGKTTLLEVLRGARRPQAGTVRHGVGLRMSVTEQVEEPWAGAGADLTVGDVLREVNPALRDGDVWRVTAEVGVPSGPGRRVAELSGGERRRLTLARIAVSDAHLLVLDEPTHHLDLRAVEALEDLLERYAGTVLLASHDRRLVERVATRSLHVGSGELHHGS